MDKEITFKSELRVLGYRKGGTYKPNLYYIPVPKKIVNENPELLSMIGKDWSLEVTIKQRSKG